MNWETVEKFGSCIAMLGTYLEAMKYCSKIPQVINNSFKYPEHDIGDIFNEIMQEDLHVGSNISTEGYLLKYGQVFKPYTHLNSVWSGTSDKDIQEINRVNKDPLHKCKKNDFVCERRRFYIPVQVIPPTRENGCDIGCAFIYDSRFTGFTSSKDLLKASKKNLLIEENKYAKPILVIYDVKKHSQFINKKVHIKGKIVIVPSNILSLLNIIPDNDIWEICSNFYRPKNENENMICLSLLEDNSKINFVDNHNLNENFDELCIPLFVESTLDKFSKLNDDVASQLIYDILPNTVTKANPLYGSKAMSFHDEGEKAFSFPSTNEINVIYRNPGVVGFYTTTSLVDTEKYSRDLDELSRYINNFAIDYKNLSRKHFGEADKLDVTFLFDYNKKDLFKSRDSNICFSDEKQWSGHKNSVSDTIGWLGQNSKQTKI